MPLIGPGCRCLGTPAARAEHVDSNPVGAAHSAWHSNVKPGPETTARAAEPDSTIYLLASLSVTAGIAWIARR